MYIKYCNARCWDVSPESTPLIHCLRKRQIFSVCRGFAGERFLCILHDCHEELHCSIFYLKIFHETKSFLE